MRVNWFRTTATFMLHVHYNLVWRTWMRDVAPNNVKTLEVGIICANDWLPIFAENQESTGEGGGGGRLGSLSFIARGLTTLDISKATLPNRWVRYTASVCANGQPDIRLRQLLNVHLNGYAGTLWDAPWRAGSSLCPLAIVSRTPVARYRYVCR
jgi:hypothetical protein